MACPDLLPLAGPVLSRTPLHRHPDPGSGPGRQARQEWSPRKRSPRPFPARPGIQSTDRQTGALRWAKVLPQCHRANRKAPEANGSPIRSGMTQKRAAGTRQSNIGKITCCPGPEPGPSPHMTAHRPRISLHSSGAASRYWLENINLPPLRRQARQVESFSPRSSPARPGIQSTDRQTGTLRWAEVLPQCRPPNRKAPEANGSPIRSGMTQERAAGARQSNIGKVTCCPGPEPGPSPHMTAHRPRISLHSSGAASRYWLENINLPPLRMERGGDA